MRLHAPSIDDKELPVTMNPGSGKPFGFIHFGNTHHCAELVIRDDADADRIIRAAAKLKAMRAQLGKPHPFTSAEWSGPSGGHCDLCGMLGDSPDHAAPASCGHPANEDGECDCSSWPERAPYDTQEHGYVTPAMAERRDKAADEYAARTQQPASVTA